MFNLILWLWIMKDDPLHLQVLTCFEMWIKNDEMIPSIGRQNFEFFLKRSDTFIKKYCPTQTVTPHFYLIIFS